MALRLVLLGLLGLAGTACNDDASQFVFEARIVDGDDANPVAGTDATTLRLAIAEGGLPVRQLDYPVSDGEFDASLEFASFSSITRIRVEIQGPTTALLTAPPAFVPSTTLGFMKLVTAAPASCTQVMFDRMEAPRARFGMVQSGTFALMIGGTGASEEQAEFLDALEWETRPFEEDLSISTLGDTRAATIGEGRILVLSADASPFIFDMLDANRRVTPLVLHAGAGVQSALVSVPGLGAMAIGGRAAGVPRQGVSLVEPDGTVRSLQLSEPRSNAAAAVLGQDVLVVGGNATGNAEVLLAGSDVGQPVAGVSDGVRSGALLIGDGTSRALLLGGLDQADAVRQDSLRFDACPSNCSASVGPVWTTARIGGTVPEQSTLIIGGESSPLVEKVRWSDDDVQIEPVLELSSARAFPGAIVYESGAIVVAGGEDGDEVGDGLEFCVPSALGPL